MGVLDRFEAKIDKSEDCWLWTGGDTGNGLRYGKFWDGERKVLAHRFAYTLAYGEIPVGLEVDHTCRVPKCVNPEHLKVVTRTQNMRNRDDYRIKSDGSMICGKNHLMTEDIKYVRPDGRVDCRVCINRPRARVRKDSTN